MYQIDVKRYQWVIDMLFGVAFLLPMSLYIGNILGQGAILVSIGVGVGYILHVTQKMLVFTDMLDEVVEEKAETKVEERASDKVEEKADTKVEETVDEKLEDGRVEKRVNEEASDKVEEKVEETVEEKIDGDLKDGTSSND